MPIPLKKSEEGWQFDTPHAAKEIVDRHIGRNELAAIQVCLALVDAEREYAMQDRDGDAVPGYASKFSVPWQTRRVVLGHSGRRALESGGALACRCRTGWAPPIRVDRFNALSWLSVSTAH